MPYKVNLLNFQNKNQQYRNPNTKVYILIVIFTKLTDFPDFPL
jgi:hypothetical protein